MKTSSAAEHNIQFICLQERMYYHSEQELHTMIPLKDGHLSARKHSVNTTIESAGMLLSPRAIKSRNSRGKIKPSTWFNGKICTTTVSCYCLNDTDEEIDIITFYNKISSLVQHIPNISMISGYMNAHIVKDGNYQFCLYNHQTERRISSKLFTRELANMPKYYVPDYVFINKWINSALKL